MSRLNSLVTWHWLSDRRRLQVRFPDGDHITFEKDCEEIACILEGLAVGVQQNFGKLGSALIELLNSRQVLIDDELPDMDTIDWVRDGYDYSFVGLVPINQEAWLLLTRLQLLFTEMAGSPILFATPCRWRD
jgi:hypothetical protein